MFNFVSAAGAVRRVRYQCRSLCPAEGATETKNVPSEQIVKNRILRQLPAGELEALQPWLTPFALVQGEILHESGTEVASVYFPTDGMVSLLAITEAGEAIETGIVGADGLVGGGVTLNGHLFGQAIVQIGGSALKFQKDQFVEAYNTHKTLRKLVNRFQAILLVQAQQCVVCHALHSVNSRLCRSLLQSQDMIGATQFTSRRDFLSHMLGCAEEHGLRGGQYAAGGRPHQVCPGQDHDPRPAGDRGMLLRMLFGDPTGDDGSRLGDAHFRLVHLGLLLLGGLLLKVGRHDPQAGRNSKVNGRARHRDEQRGLPPEIVGTHHHIQP
jgi:CRP-like cAMP-binding protein